MVAVMELVVISRHMSTEAGNTIFRERSLRQME
jgi:hypothetical protein